MAKDKTISASAGAALQDIPPEERSAINPNKRKGKNHAAYSQALKTVVATVKDSARANTVRERKIGRPLLYPYREDIAEEIAVRLCNGETLIDICDNDERMPNRMAVYYWIETVPAFSALYARARIGFGDHAAHHAVNAAKAATPETAAADRILVDAFKWYAEKAAPRLFNSRIAEGEAHRDATTINNVTNNVLIDARAMEPGQRDALRSLLIDATARPKGDD